MIIFTWFITWPSADSQITVGSGSWIRRVTADFMLFPVKETCFLSPVIYSHSWSVSFPWVHRSGMCFCLLFQCPTNPGVVHWNTQTLQTRAQRSLFHRSHSFRDVPHLESRDTQIIFRRHMWDFWLWLFCFNRISTAFNCIWKRRLVTDCVNTLVQI